MTVSIPELDFSQALKACPLVFTPSSALSKLCKPAMYCHCAIVPSLYSCCKIYNCITNLPTQIYSLFQANISEKIAGIKILPIEYVATPTTADFTRLILLFTKVKNLVRAGCTEIIILSHIYCQDQDNTFICTSKEFVSICMLLNLSTN